jgi:hypothetical protein
VGNCTAVGNYNDASGHLEGLLLTESGGAWAVAVEASAPANAGAEPFVALSSVSCASVGNCSAIGGYDDSTNTGQGLLLTETAGTWSIGIEATAPANARAPVSVTLNSISCASAGNCAGVGTYVDSLGETQGLLLLETGGVWGAGSEAGLPANARGSALSSVSCSSGGSCAAVGDYYDGTNRRRGLLLGESGGAWATGTEAALPGDLASAPNVDLNAVSCSGPGSCAAVGSALDTPGAQQGILLDENDGSWTMAITAEVPVNAGEGPSESLGSISCPAPGNCVAVGNYGDLFSDSAESLVLSEVGGSWLAGSEVVLPPNADALPHASLASVSCPTAGNCAAVGSYADTSGERQGLLLSEVDGSWTTGTEVALPADAAANPAVALNSVSCASPGNCAAVGTYDDDDSTGDTRGLLLNEVAGSWGAATEAVLPANARFEPFVALASVSCGSPGSCTAVGSYSDSADRGQGLLVNEIGGTWASGTAADLPANAAAAGPGVLLTSVSCPSAGNCSAVGSYDDTSSLAHGLLLSESGGAWVAPNEASLPANAEGPVISGVEPAVVLSSVSCAYAGYCAGVGWYDDSSGNEQGLLLNESGGTWATGTEASLPANANLAPEVSLNSVSCPSVGYCSAVGRYRGGPYQGLLLDEVGGTWAPASEASLPANASTLGAAVNDVSCPSPGNCGAIGSYRDAFNIEHGLLADSTAGPAPSPAAVGPSNSSPPVVSGGDRVGVTLSGSNGTWSGSAPLLYLYQWQRCTPTCANIATGTASTYRLTAADTGAEVRIVVTALDSAGYASADSTEKGPIKPSIGQVRAALSHVLTPRGSRARIATILRNRGYTFTFTAPSAGLLTIVWYQMSAAGHVARASRAISVASGSKRFRSARQLGITVRLTNAGRRLMKHARRLRLTVIASFAPAGEQKISVRGRFTLVTGVRHRVAARFQPARAGWPSGLAQISCASASMCVATALRSGQLVVSRNPKGGAGAWHTVTVLRSTGPTWRDVACRSAGGRSVCLARQLLPDRLVFSGDPTGGPGAWEVGGQALTNIGGNYPSVACPSISLCLANSGFGVYRSTRPGADPREWTSTLFTAYPAGEVGILSCPSVHFCARPCNSTSTASGRPSVPRARLRDGSCGACIQSSSMGRPRTLACASRYLCVAIGSVSSSPPGFVVSTDPMRGGGAWKYAAVPGAVPGESPVAVSCPSLTLCVALTSTGGLGVPAGIVISTRPAAGAGAWNLTRLVNPGIALHGLSCASRSFCAAVGTLGARSVVLTTRDPAGGASAWHTTTL